MGVLLGEHASDGNMLMLLAPNQLYIIQPYGVWHCYADIIMTPHGCCGRNGRSDAEYNCCIVSCQVSVNEIPLVSSHIHRSLPTP